MGDVEQDYCSSCDKLTEVSRRYYYYTQIECECCGNSEVNGHFEIVKYCKDCTPSPPEWIKVSIKPNSIHI